MILDTFVQGATPKTIVVALIVVCGLFTVYKWISDERKIRMLGGHAPRVRSYAPFGLDIVVKTVRSALNHKVLEQWTESFRLASQYTCEGNLAGLRFIFTADPENMKAILATQFQDYGKGPDFHEEWKDFLGDSIFTTDLEQWHASRQLIRPQFIKDRVSDLVVFEKHVQILIRAVANGGVMGVPGTASDGVGRGRKVDVSDLFFRYTLDAATDFLLGSSVNSLETPKQEFAQAFGEVQRMQYLITMAGPLNALIPRVVFKKQMTVINEFVNPYIEKALRLSPEELASKTKSDTGYTFLHALAGFTRDRKVLRDQLVAVLLAGRDTTACTLSWTFFELSRHPEVFEKLRAEIIDKVGLERPPTYQDLKDMKYLQNTMNETLRLYPVVPFNVRRALHDTTLPHGGGPDGQSPIGVLKGNAVAYSPLAMQRRRDLYPETPWDPSLDPLNFNPARWETWQPKHWHYIPFNGGPRICIGQQFALTEMGYTIVRMLQRFERVAPLGEGLNVREPLMKTDIVLQPGMGVWVGFWEQGKRTEK